VKGPFRWRRRGSESVQNCDKPTHENLIFDENLTDSFQYDEKLGFGFYAVKPTLPPREKSQPKEIPPLDPQVELWLEKLIQERRVQSHLLTTSGHDAREGKGSSEGHGEGSLGDKKLGKRKGEEKIQAENRSKDANEVKPSRKKSVTSQERATKSRSSHEFKAKNKS